MELGKVYETKIKYQFKKREFIESQVMMLAILETLVGRVLKD